MRWKAELTVFTYIIPAFNRSRINLNVLFQTVSKESGNRMRRIEKLQALLADPENAKFNFANFDQLALPLDPEVGGKRIWHYIFLVL